MYHCDTNHPRNIFVEECNDIVHQVCTETQVQVQTHANVIGHAVAAPAAVAAVPAGLAAVPAGVAAPGLLSSALRINGAALPAGVVPAGPQLLHHGLGKRDADADAEADADADADAQFLGLNTFPVGPLAAGPAPLALAAAPAAVAAPIAPVAPVAPVAVAAPVAAPVAVAPQCHQKVDRQCRQVPVQT